MHVNVRTDACKSLYTRICTNFMHGDACMQAVDTDALSGGRLGQNAVYFFCGHAFDEDSCARHPDTGTFVCSICQTDPRKQHIRRTAPAREVCFLTSQSPPPNMTTPPVHLSLATT